MPNQPEQPKNSLWRDNALRDKQNALPNRPEQPNYTPFDSAGNKYGELRRTSKKNLHVNEQPMSDCLLELLAETASETVFYADGELLEINPKFVAAIRSQLKERLVAAMPSSVKCEACNGTGKVWKNKEEYDDWRQKPTHPCPVCNATGKVEPTITRTQAIKAIEEVLGGE